MVTEHVQAAKAAGLTKEQYWFVINNYKELR